MIVKPTIEEMKDAWREDGGPLTHKDDVLEGRWRHGTEHQFIAHRESDDTYWSIHYRTDKDGEYNDFRDGHLSEDDIYQVIQQEKIIKHWVAVKTQD